MTALVAGIAVATFGIAARPHLDSQTTQTAPVFKAGGPVVVTSLGSSDFR
jgi:hypothetical protein